MIWVMYPTSSLGKAFLLNPEAIKDFAPKLELELLIDWSPPFSVEKCSAYPIANTETFWMYASLIVLIWKFLYVGLKTARESELIFAFCGEVLSKYTPLLESYLTNALLSFWSPMPVNWAITIDLNPPALSPSARTPHIP